MMMRHGPQNMQQRKHSEVGYGKKNLPIHKFLQIGLDYINLLLQSQIEAFADWQHR